ncbi:MAG: TonB family protein [Terracidiphilus sp.]
MFEDSTFESTSRIHTRSRGWMIATFAFNSSILLALILIPLIYPEALPQIASAILMEAPTPVEEPKPVAQPEHATAAQSQLHAGVLQAPTIIPDKPWIPSTREEPMPVNVAALDGGGNGTGSPDSLFNGHNAQPTVRQAVKSTQLVSSGVMAGYLICKVVPNYPAIARTIRLSGTVMLQATISRSGTIENLRVVSGPAMLQQAALDAVQQWRYRPYLLNGKPVEVDTTVDVDFTLQ